LASERVERRLTAIFAADVAGYSQLMGSDEEGTLTQLKAHRRILVDPKINEHRGRIVKTTGDGMLVEFASVVDAVRCAVDVQRGMVERSAGVPQEKRIEFRIGINVGDIIIDGGDIFGDGVNVAARLESIAEPGGICLSEDAYRQMSGRVDLPVCDLGPQSLKNIAQPVRAYSLGSEAIAALPPVVFPISRPVGSRSNIAWRSVAGLLVVIAIAGGGAVWHFHRTATAPVLSSVSADQPKPLPKRLSIVVLPFANLSGDSAQDYLADVITEELTTTLSRIAGSFVIARSTAFTYKGKPIDAKQVGRDLGVRYVLEGSAQLSGSRVRVSAQLIDAESGAHLWADQFNSNRADLLEMQDEIVKRLSSPLEIRLIDVDAARVARAPPGNLDAQDLALQCMAGALSMHAETVMPDNAAIGFCDRALQIDNRNAIALTFRSLRYIVPVLTMQSTDPQAAIGQAEELASRALVVDRNFYWAHLARATVLIAQKRSEEAIVELEQTLAINPGFTAGYGYLCEANNFLGRPEKCVEYADKAIRLSPRDPVLGWLYGEKGWALLMQQQDDQAIEWVRRALAVSPNVSIQQALLTSALALTGRQAEAREALERYLSLKTTTSKTIAQFRHQHRSLSDNPKWLAYSDRLVEGLRLAGMPEE
jgi:adenylate cyclase